MGVNGLTTFIGRCEKIDMRVEIKNFHRFLRRQRERHIQRKPTIIVDILSLTHLFLGGIVGMLGGRHDVCLKILKEFFKELIDVGAVLIFFCDGQVQEDKVPEWCVRSDARYKRSIKLMRKGSANNRNQFKCDLLWKRVRSLIEDNNFGEIILSRNVDCDRAIAKYASYSRNNVLAVVSNDTDMLIFDGDFQVWSINSIESIKLCKAEHLDRKKLLNDLNLSRNQMKIFATIKGNDFTKRFDRDMNWLIGNTVRTVSDITKTISHGDFNVNLYKNIAEAMLKPGVVIENIHIQSVKKSLQFYSLDFQFEESSREINVLKSCFENGYAMQYDVQFMDFESNFINILLEAFQKIGGILSQQPGNERLNQLKIVTKRNKEENYQLKLYPICSNNVENENDIKWNNLLYSLGLQLDIKDLKKITQTKDYITMTILTGLVLLKANQITERQANLLLLMHCNILMENVSVEKLKIPHKCEYNTIRTVQAFLKTFTLVDDFYYICFKEYTKYAVSFDGVYYYDLMTKIHEGRERSELIKCLGSEIETIYKRLKQSVLQN